MNIGIDVDGVMTDLVEYILERGHKYLYEHNEEIKDVDLSHYNTRNIFNISKELDFNIWADMIMDYAENERPRMFTAEVIRKLKEKGHKIYIITARYSMTEEQKKGKLAEKALENWLEKNNIVYDELIFEEDKKKAIVDKNIDLMVDDSPYVISDVSKFTNVVIFDAPYNKNKEFAEHKRVNSWYQLLDYIEKYIEKN